MKHIRLLSLLLIMAIVSQVTCVYGGPFLHEILKKAPPCYSCPDYIKDLIVYKQKQNFVRYNKNYLQWKNYNAVQHLFWSMRNTGARKMKVLHFGDSHVQADIFTHEIRQRMMAGFGVGGRGMVFPYNAAKTHPGIDYLTSFTGRWDNTKNINFIRKYDLGVSGVTIHTNDKTASFSIKFYPNSNNQKNTILKIYRKYSPESFDLKVQTRQFSLPVFVPNFADSGKAYVTVPIPENTDYVTVYMKQSEPKQSFFECYGLSFETEEEGGVLYNSVGINGASLSSILSQNLMDEQIKEMQPDLLVLDLGGNDWYLNGINEADYQYKMEAIIQRFKKAAPEASIIIGTSQDIYRYGNSLMECAKASEIAKKVAFENDCAFYDYYTIAGGRYSMLKWLKAGLAQYDRVHLNHPGYQLRGELFYNAILNSYYDVLLKGHVEASEYPIIITPDTDVPAGLTSNTLNTTTPIVSERTVSFFPHTVRYGEYLGLIAQRNGLSVQTLMWDNELNSTYLKAGQILKIRKTTINPAVKSIPIAKATPTIPATKIVASKTTPTIPTASKATPHINNTTTASKPAQANSFMGSISKVNATFHTVKSGDNLWNLSVKYKTTVENIKNLNPGKVNKLVPGQVIRIK